MKAPRTETEQMGTAAVDLFASGMGAFILIAMVFMVLFAASPQQEVIDTPTAEALSCPEPVSVECPEIPACPDCPPQLACPAAPECESCPPVPECESCPPVPVPECPESPPCPTVEPVSCPAAVPCPICPEPTPTVVPKCPEVEPLKCPEPIITNTILPDTDLVFIIDATGSMFQEIESLKRELHLVVEVLERMMPSVAVSVIPFYDRYQRPPIRHFPLRRLTGEPNAMRDIQRFLRSISMSDAKGPNPDIPEAILTALNAAVRDNFREDVVDRTIIVITDAYAYEEEMERSYQVARAFASTTGQKVSVVHVRQNPVSQKYLQQLAEAGKGEFVPDSGSILANVLLSVIGADELDSSTGSAP